MSEGYQRVVAVTGAGSGIGFATAEAFVATGATVVGLDVRPGEHVPGIDWVVCDVTDDASVASAFAMIDERYGRLDAVVNNAGIGSRGSVEQTTDADWYAVFEVNVFGVARVSRHAIPLLRRGEAASIVNVASNTALAGTPLRAVYSASKGAVSALTRSMATDLVGDRIRVNAIYPGPVHTSVTGRYDADPAAAVALFVSRMPLKHLIAVEEIASAIVYLADSANRSLTGSAFHYDGGLTELINFGTA